MSTAIIFNGQGAHYQGMGLDWIQKFPQSKQVFDQAEDQTGFPISQWIESDFSKLNQTRYAQVAIAATSLAIYRAIEGLLPEISYMAGLSLGEYAALVAGGYLAQEEAWLILKERGELMSVACENVGETGMAAYINIESNQLQDLIESGGLSEKVVIANYNSPLQTVVAGQKEGLADLKKLAKAAGVKTILPLKVEGPFHSKWMQSAVPAFREALDRVPFSTGHTPVLSNVTGQVHEPSKMKLYLGDHLVAPVKWRHLIDYMVDQGVSQIIQIGPGASLSKLLAQHHPQVQCITVDQVSDLEKLTQLKEKFHD